MLYDPCSSVGSTRLFVFALVRERTAGLRAGMGRLFVPLHRYWVLVAGFGPLDELGQLDQPDAESPRNVADRSPLWRAASELDLGQGPSGDAGIEGDVFLAAFWLTQAQLT
jgi:hypothetical protein